MKKLALHLDSLRVETFEAETASEARGTVPGHGLTAGTYGCQGCESYTCGVAPAFPRREGAPVLAALTHDFRCCV